MFLRHRQHHPSIHPLYCKVMKRLTFFLFGDGKSEIRHIAELVIRGRDVQADNVLDLLDFGVIQRAKVAVKDSDKGISLDFHLLDLCSCHDLRICTVGIDTEYVKVVVVLPLIVALLLLYGNN